MIPFLMILILIIYFIISDLVPILKKKQGKEFWIYSILITAGFVLNVMKYMNYKFPIISVAIKKIVGIFVFLLMLNTHNKAI